MKKCLLAYPVIINILKAPFRRQTLRTPHNQASVTSAWGSASDVFLCNPQRPAGEEAGGGGGAAFTSPNGAAMSPLGKVGVLGRQFCLKAYPLTIHFVA